ncbi:MAG: Rpn family recombination-promoting nuclease/putative transposase [Lachnospiraceae bacterium]|nr:Rpn family recombination-promoting nuclease/putative transposase [Lachnospiraceae bacterium]
MQENKNLRKEEVNDDFIMMPKVDFCFKEIMYNAKVRLGFISAVLQIQPKNIKRTTLLNTNLRKSKEKEKLGILDVRVELMDKRQIDMEMQVREYDYWEERSTYYLSKMYVDQINEGDDYEKLQKCIHISILDFKLFSEEKDFYSQFHLREDTRGLLYTDKLEIHVIELPKVKQMESEYPKSELLDWAKFFNIKNRKELDNMMNTNEYIDEACNEVVKISSDEEKRLEYEARLKAERDYNAGMKTSYRKGHEDGVSEGIELGRDEEKTNIFKNLRALGIEDEDFLAKATGLTLEKIQELMKMIDKED